MKKINRALVSVWDKTDLEKLLASLHKHDIEIVSTGGSLSAILEMGYQAMPIGDFTKFPEMLDGRVKTLHPGVHGGLLYNRDNEEHRKQINEHGLQNIDLVVVNLYPFVETISQAGVSFDHAIENIDIGGPTMLRAAAKNHKYVAALIDIGDYQRIILELDENDGCLSLETRFELARKVFNYTAGYDAAVAAYFNDLQGIHQPSNLNLAFKINQKLRYGENPHQSATLYSDQISQPGSLVAAKQHQGKQLSFNNILDFDAAINIVEQFEKPCVVIIKHNNPAGVAIGLHDSELASVYEQAWSCDPVSAFGAIVAINRIVDQQTAGIIINNFVEGIIAPGYTVEALAILKAKKNLRLLDCQGRINSTKKYDIKRISGGMLLQEEDNENYGAESILAVTKKHPDDQQRQALDFAWRVCKFTKSNAIIISGEKKIFGVGAGQMSRIDSVLLAGEKAKKFNHPVNGAVLASDAFFPFRDGIDLAAKFGVKAIIQPGGSIRDDEIITACDDHGISMLFTQIRHFRH